MEALVNLFQKHISPEKLFEYRWGCLDGWKNFLALVSKVPNTISTSSSNKGNTDQISINHTDILIPFSEYDKQKVINLSELNWPIPKITNEEDAIPTGSNVEGANLARLFFEDTKGEFEFDLMYQIAEVNNRMYFEPCDQSNLMFVHIGDKMEPNQKDELLKKFGDEILKVLVYNSSNGKSYLSTNFIKSKLNDVFNAHPETFKTCGGLFPNVTISEWDPEDAAKTISLILSNDSKYTGTRESDPQKFEKELRNKVLTASPEFEQQANDELQMLKQIQDNFLASRLEGKQKVEQISLAIKWSKQCLLLTDILCNHRLETVCYYVMQAAGFDGKEYVENMRNPLKKWFEYHLSIFKTLLHEPDSVETEQELFGFERYMKGLATIVAFDVLLQQELLFMELMRLSESEDFNPKNLSKVSERITKYSLDFVLCIKYSYWPELAAEWQNRKREWPEQSLVKQIVTNGIHIVCKKLRHKKIDWRLSFSVAEIEITRQWTCWQHYIYFIFKSLFYKYLKPLSNKSIKIITSFLVKTVMLNVSESFAQSWWCKENAGECLNVLLMTLLSAFEKKSLPHHFVPSFNLLERASFDKKAERILDSAINTLNSLLLIPEEEVLNLSATLEIIEDFVNAINTQTSMMKELNTRLTPFFDSYYHPFRNYDFSKWKKK